MVEADLPMVSIIAPCRNEAAFIEEAVRTILENDYPADRMELLVVDGMSTDGTREIIEKMAAKDSRLKLMDNPKKIVPSAMNIGIKASRGEYIARIDCHSSYDSSYLRKCISLARRTGAENAGGYWTILPGADTSVAKAIAVAAGTRFGVGNSLHRTNGIEQETDTVAFGTFRKEIFEKVGLYDERLVRNQDMELNYRIHRAGGRIVISPEIKVGYYNRATYRGLWQQSFNNGLWNPYTVWLAAGRGLSWRHFIPMFFVSGLITLTIGSFFWWPVKWMLVIYTLLYVSIATFFSVKHARQKKVSPILLFCSYTIMHMGYGLGSVWAIITIPFKFPNRHKQTIGEALADRKP